MWKCNTSAITLLTMVFAAGVSADFVFTVQFPLFRFSSGSSPQRTVRDQCCVCCEDPISETCPASCNSTLLVCIRDADHPLTDNSCSLGEIVAPVDPATIMQLSGTFQGPWEGIGQVSMILFHYNVAAAETADITIAAAENLLDVIFINQITLPPSAPPTLATGFNGSFETVELAATFQVACALNFFGADCNTMCENRDDSLGHFTCDPVTGERVCLDGYRDVEGNCTTCVPSAGCSSIGGMCFEPGECTCRAGFSGNNCSESISASALPSTLGFISAPQTSPMPTSVLTNQISSIAERQSLPTLSTQTTPSTSALQLLPSPVTMEMIQTTPTVAPNRDPEKDMTTYIISGAVVAAVLFVLITLVTFALIMVVNRRRFKKRASQEQNTRNGGTSSRYTSTTTLDRLDPYMDVLQGQDANDSLSHPPTYSTFQHQRDSGIMSQGTMDDERTYATPDVFRARMQSESDERISHDQVFDEDLGYTRPIVVTKSTPEHKAVLNQEHEYAVLECREYINGSLPVSKVRNRSRDIKTEGTGGTSGDGASGRKGDAGILGGDLVTEDDIVFQDGNIEEEMLDSIERTMTQITHDLQAVGEETNEPKVSAEGGFSFIYSDTAAEGQTGYS